MMNKKGNKNVKVVLALIPAGVDLRVKTIINEKFCYSATKAIRNKFINAKRTS
ncbi:hypothetical protein SCACP_05910 [Sporomusa carbonis]|uniref:hypothetical protein n=1 Tax=Sporomusa carbonis TaxID=3076075 RepID=UPI003A708E0D